MIDQAVVSFGVMSFEKRKNKDPCKRRDEPERRGDHDSVSEGLIEKFSEKRNEKSIRQSEKLGGQNHHHAGDGDVIIRSDADG